MARDLLVSAQGLVVDHHGVPTGLSTVTPGLTEEEVTTIAETAADDRVAVGLATLPSIDAIRPGPVITSLSAANITTASTSNLLTGNMDSTGTASAKDSDLLITSAEAGMWVRLQQQIYVPNTTAVTLTFGFRSIVAGAAVNTFAISPWNIPSGVAASLATSATFQLQTGDISGGVARLRPSYGANGIREIQANVLFPARFEAQVAG